MPQPVPTRQEADAILAKQPWARVCKELTLYVVALTGSSDAHARPVASAIARARAELWSFRERPVWTFLTDAVVELLPEDARRGAAAEAARIPMLGNDELDAELRARGIDPGNLALLGNGIKREVAARVVAPPPRMAPPAPRAATRPRPSARRPELPALSPRQWAVLSFFVLVIAALALAGSKAASRYFGR